MCGIAGFCNFKVELLESENKWVTLANKMSKAIAHRGPDGTGSYINSHVTFSHVRLAIRDLVTGAQPLQKIVNGKEYSIVYNGQIYNSDEMKSDLLAKGYEFTTTSDTEVALVAYIHYGVECFKEFNGIFAFAIWDGKESRCVLCRDKFGIKPLFYTVKDDFLVFGSEIKALFEFPSVKPQIDKEGLSEIFALGPARELGFGVFKNIFDILPGEFAIYDNTGLKKHTYWSLESKPHTDSYEETIQKISFLVKDAVKRQLVSDVPLCTFLSGGPDHFKRYKNSSLANDVRLLF